jgi:hypothetical protein
VRDYLFLHPLGFCCVSVTLTSPSVSLSRSWFLADGDRSLLALANCITALGDKRKKGAFVNYRDSKLTRLLKACCAACLHHPCFSLSLSL